MRYSSKPELRKEMLEKRDALSEEEIHEKSRAICERLKDLDIFKRAKSVLLYWSVQSEVRTIEFIGEYLEKKDVYLPFTKPHTLGWARLRSVRDLQVGMFDIPEPQHRQAPIPDIAVIPGVAFDVSGSRLGRGKGFYDRTLSRLNIPTVALAFDCQIIDEVPANRRDMPVDVIITETRTIKVRS